jgi:hypothetical protein
VQLKKNSSLALLLALDTALQNLVRLPPLLTLKPKLFHCLLKRYPMSLALQT